MRFIDKWTVPITSSNVYSSVKRKGLTGKGEITIYFGQGDESEQRFKDFFNTRPCKDGNGKDTYCFSEEDLFYFPKHHLINYLYSVQFEYNYQIIGQYNDVSYAAWEQKLAGIKSEPNEQITFSPRCVINPTNTQGRRLYLKSLGGRSGSFIKIMRIPLAEITEVTVYKYDTGSENYTFEFVFSLKTDMTLETKEDVSEVDEPVTKELDAGQNLIVFGAPGTGKSHYLNRNFQENSRRVTFHPEYTYYDFIGSYRPIPVYKQDESIKLVDNSGEEFLRGEPMIDYRFTPGPFTLSLADAIKDQNRMYTLVIEELNRANAPAVFGDLFQLLDRDEAGKSTYAVTNIEIQNYLKSISGIEKNIHDNEIIIPSNLNIVATMNSADQGVFVLNSAFKRRWNFEYLPINTEESEHRDELVPYKNGLVRWEEFIIKINELLSSEIIGVNEDKHIGPYFIKPTDLIGRAEEEKQSLIAYKLLIYLWDDVVRHKRSHFFVRPTTFSNLVNRYREGFEIIKTNFETSLIYEGEEATEYVAENNQEYMEGADASDTQSSPKDIIE